MSDVLGSLGSSLDSLLADIGLVEKRRPRSWLESLAPQDVLYALLVLTWTKQLWDQYLNYRQRVKYAQETPKPNVHLLMDDEQYERSRLYSMDKNYFGCAKGLYSQCEQSVWLFFGLHAVVWGLVGEYMDQYGFTPRPDYEVLQTILVLSAFMVWDLIFDSVWDYYYHFVIEERHGFNNQTISFWIRDTLKKFALNVVFTTILISILIPILRYGGEYVVFMAAGFVFVFSLIMISIFPAYIAPLFDNYVEMPEGSLKTDIENLAVSVKFPLAKLFVMDASNRSNHSNAFFFGLIEKRIVLFDTLVDLKTRELVFPDREKKRNDKEESEGCTNREVCAILAHELGHWAHMHTILFFVLQQIVSLFTFSVIAALMDYDNLYKAIGFEHEKPIIFGMYVIATGALILPSEIFGFVLNYLSRTFEFQADRYAIDQGFKESLVTALRKINADNLGFPDPDWLYSTRKYSHPPMLERIEVIQNSKEKST
eukprot:Clim_evm33s22 gene=Clim_evmTU33s22